MNLDEWQAQNVDVPPMWTLVHDGERPITVNWQRTAPHWNVVREKVAMWRQAFYWRARQAQIPYIERLEFEIVPLHKDMRSAQDTGACAPAAKAAIDGIMCAIDGLAWDDPKVDDGPTRVLGEQFRPPACGSGVDGLMVIVRAMTEPARERTEKGQTLLVPMTDAVVSVLARRVGKVSPLAWGRAAGQLLDEAVTADG